MKEWKIAPCLAPSSGDRDAAHQPTYRRALQPLQRWMPASPEAQTAAYEQRSSGLQSLKFREIEAVRKQMMIDARDTCHETRAAYVECAKGGDPATTQPRGCLIALVCLIVHAARAQVARSA